MKYKSQVFSQASGSVGGLTFSRGAGGNYTRARAIPTNRNSPGQIAQRARFQYFTQQWSALTTDDIQAWNIAAKLPEWKVKNSLGDMISLSGKAFYMKQNLNIAMISPDAIISPPAFVPLSNVGELTADITNTTFDVTIEVVTSANVPAVIWATPPQGRGVSYNANQFRFITQLVADTTIDIRSIYENMFGAVPISSQKCCVRVYQLSRLTGIQGPWSEVTVFG